MAVTHPTLSKQSGFTLIELIVVIAIVGILAAIAMPRLIAAQRDARIAKMQATYGGMRSAMMMARGRCELDRANPESGGNKCTTTANEEGYTRMDGTEIAMINSYPRAQNSTTQFFDNGDGTRRPAQSILAAAQIDTKNDGFSADTSSDANNGINRFILKLTLDSANRSSECIITYMEARMEGSSILAPSVSLDVSGC